MSFQYAKFFDECRKSEVVFPKNAFTQEQVDGLNYLLDVWATGYTQYPLEWLAYCLATAYHETAFTMQPIYEYGSRTYFNKYDIQHNPKKARELGNTEPGDGYKFRGAGYVQNTGRRNARVSSNKINATFGLETDFERHPEQRIEPKNAAHCLFLGSIEGWYTSKQLRQYLDPPKLEWGNARRVINGKDKAVTIANYAVAFLDALNKAGGQPSTQHVLNEADGDPVIVDEEPDPRDQTQTVPDMSWLPGFIRWLKYMLGLK